MTSDTFKTISKPAEGLFKIKGSKFLSFAFPAEEESIIKEHLVALKREYHDARHHCYAYRIGIVEPFQYRFNDNGEPSGTAGNPIYGQIQSYEVTNLLVVVVRYFGGTLLGTSGLIKAYRAAAEDVLNNSVIVEKVVQDNLKLNFPYDKMNEVMRIIKEESVEILNQDFQTACEMNVLVKKSRKTLIVKRFELIQHMKVLIV